MDDNNDKAKTAIGVIVLLLAMFGLPIGAGIYSRSQSYTAPGANIAAPVAPLPAPPPPPVPQPQYNETPAVLDEPEEYYEEEGELCEGYPTVCEDGTCSYSTGRGTCSWHGGVWYYRY